MPRSGSWNLETESLCCRGGIFVLKSVCCGLPLTSPERGGGPPQRWRGSRRRETSCDNLVCQVYRSLQVPARRIPKGDRKALWSRPQARKPTKPLSHPQAGDSSPASWGAFVQVRAGTEGFQRAIGKPFGRACRRENPVMPLSHPQAGDSWPPGILH